MRAPADPVANLNVLASRVRGATGAPWLVTAAAGGYLVPADERCVVDAERFLAEVSQGRHLAGEARHAEALGVFEAALARWVGEPLAEDLYSDWAQPYRRMLYQERGHALEGAAEAALAVGDPLLALRRAEQSVAADPLRESAQLLRVRALAAAGDPAGAAEAFAAFRRQLAEETGLEPSAAAEQLHSRLLRGGLSVTAGVRAPRRSPSGGPMPELPFVGRDAELDAVLAHGGVTLLEGAAGVGKSRLLAEVARRAARPVVSVRAFLAERDEPWSLARDLLRDCLAADVSVVRRLPDRTVVALADVVPEVAEVREVPGVVIDPESRRVLAVEGALRLVQASLGHGLLLVDDLQWADASSLALLTRICGRLPYLTVVLAYRPEEAPPLDEVRRTGPVTRLSVAPLSPEAVAELVSDPGLAHVLTEHTDRTPMAIGEVIRTLASDAAVIRRDDGRWAPAGPPIAPHAAAGQGLVMLAVAAARAGQRRAIQARVADQPAGGRDLLRLLALLGRETPARLLAEAVGRDQPEVLGQLDGLARAGLARLGDRGWATAHDLVAEAVADGIDPVARGALHAGLARALAADHGDPAELARHLAGAGDADAAATAYAAGSAAALHRYADQEAHRLATAGLQLDPKPAVAGDLLETRAEARARTGDLAGAGEDLRGALRAGAAGPARARVLARHARLAAGTDDLGHAAELVRLALAETAGDPAARAAALYAGALIDMNTDRPERARHRSDEALTLYQQIGDARGVADILDARAMATFMDGHNREAVEQFDRVARLFSDAGDLLRVVTPRSTRGHGLVFLGEPDRALAETAQALELARSLGHSDGVSYALWHRSEALAALGRADEAVAAAREAVDIAEQLGHRSWTATTHRALGIALQARGDLPAAEAAHHRTLELASYWPLLAAWACARIALVRLALDDPAGAEPYVTRALAEGPPLAHYEARLARAELAYARGDPGAATIARDALKRAEDGGHLIHVDRLALIAAG